MDDASRKAAIDLLQKLLAEDGASATVNGAATYPRVENVGGVNMMLAAPINPTFRPSMMAHILGGQPGTYVSDPSNGAEFGKPLRSAAGFPLLWGSTGGPWVLIGDQTFATDADAIDFIHRTTQTPEQIAAQKAAWDRSTGKLRNRDGGQTPAKNAQPLAPGESPL